MTKKKTEQETEQSIFGDDSLGKVRGILFGELAEETNSRIDRIEAAFEAGLEQLRADMDRHVRDLSKRISSESTKRASGERSIRSDVEASLAEVVTSLDQAQTTSRGLLDEARTELDLRIETVRADLTDAKVDRATLAALFSSTAVELQGDAVEIQLA